MHSTSIFEHLLHGDYGDANILHLLHCIQFAGRRSIKILCIHHRYDLVSVDDLCSFLFQAQRMSINFI